MSQENLPRAAYRCKACKQMVPEKPRVEKITVDGISYKRYHWVDGMTVESPCSCFGAPLRAHNVPFEQCPWYKKRQAREGKAFAADLCVFRGIYSVTTNDEGQTLWWHMPANATGPRKVAEKRVPLAYRVAMIEALKIAIKGQTIDTYDPNRVKKGKA